jgi:hypothetical protein
MGHQKVMAIATDCRRLRNELRPTWFHGHGRVDILGDLVGMI